MKWKKLVVLGAVVMGVTLGGPATAAAQFGPQSQGDFWLFSLFTTTVIAPLAVPTTTTAGGVTTTIVIVSHSAESETVKAYLEDNAVAVQHDLYMGGGDSVDDLAVMFGVPDEGRQAFESVVYDHRHQLAALAEPTKVDMDRTRRFIGIIVEELPREIRNEMTWSPTKAG